MNLKSVKVTFHSLPAEQEKTLLKTLAGLSNEEKQNIMVGCNTNNNQSKIAVCMKGANPLTGNNVAIKLSEAARTFNHKTVLEVSDDNMHTEVTVANIKSTEDLWHSKNRICKGAGHQKKCEKNIKFVSLQEKLAHI